MIIWNYAQIALKDCLPFDPAILLLGLCPKEIIRKKTCTKIFIALLFEVAKKNWKMRGWPSIGEWLNKLWFLLVMEYYCAERNNELEEFHMNWKVPQELMQSERSRVRRTSHTEMDALCHNQNVMDFSTSSNAMIQDTSEGPMRKFVIHIQRKNCERRNTEGK